MNLILIVFYLVVLPWGVFKLAQWLFRWAQEKNKTIYLVYTVSIILGSIPLWSLIPRTPTPPIFIPFDIQHAEKKTGTEIRIKESEIYIFNLRFIYDNDIKGDRDRVKKLVGDDDGTNNGIPTPFRLTVTQTKCPNSGLFFSKCFGRALIIEKTYKNLKLRSWGGNDFEKYMTDVQMEKGDYRVMLESLQDIPELIGTQIGLEIIRPKR